MVKPPSLVFQHGSADKKILLRESNDLYAKSKYQYSVGNIAGSMKPKMPIFMAGMEAEHIIDEKSGTEKRRSLSSCRSVT